MYTAANGIQLYYKKSGSGHPTVILHGNCGNHAHFNPLTNILATRYTVYTPHSRGTGKSSPARVCHYKDMAKDIAAFCRQLELQKPIVLGVGNGGIVALMLAFMYPGLPGAVVACGANMNPSGLQQYFLRVARLGYRVTKQDTLRLKLKEPHITPAQLGAIKAPTLLLAGSRDIVHKTHTLRMAKFIPHSALRIFPGETHTSYFGKNGWKLIETLLVFLAQNGL